MEVQPDVGSVDARTLFLQTVQGSLVPAWCLFSAIPGFLCLRRVTGELHAPLSPSIFVTSVALFALFAVALRRTTAAMFHRNHWPMSFGRALPILSTLGVILFVGAITLPNSSAAAIVLACVLLVGVIAEGFTSMRPIRMGPVFLKSPQTIDSQPSDAEGSELDAPLLDRSADSEDGREFEDEAAGNETILLRLTRGRTVEGRVFWHGRARVEFESGQRATAAHVAFCPAFAIPPEVAAWPLGGEAAEVRLTQNLPQGVRLEIRLDNPATAATFVTFEFTAHDAQSTRTPATEL